jgi:pimeloyl-ACP methyl ester carboxylesterase
MDSCLHSQPLLCSSLGLALGSALLVFATGCSGPPEISPLDSSEASGAVVVKKDAAYRANVKTGAFAELSQGHCYYELSKSATDATNLPLLVLVHGFSVPSFIWDPTFEEAVRRGRPVLRLDLYGRGHSSNPDTTYDMELFAGQVIELLEHLDVEELVDIAGLSMGGPICIRAAADHPTRFRTLVLISPSSFAPDYGNRARSAQPTAAEIQRFHEERMPTWADGQSSDFFNPEAFPDWVERCRGYAQHEGFARALLSTNRSTKPLIQEQHAIQSARYPVHMIWGVQDEVSPYASAKANVAARIPRAQVHLFERCGHIPQMEHPKKFNKLLFDTILNN